MIWNQDTAKNKSSLVLNDANANVIYSQRKGHGFSSFEISYFFAVPIIKDPI